MQLRVLLSRLSSLSNLDPEGSVKLFVLSDLEKVLSDLDPGGSVRIRGVLSDWNVLSEWIRGVLSESPNFYTSGFILTPRYLLIIISSCLLVYLVETYKSFLPNQ